MSSRSFGVALTLLLACVAILPAQGKPADVDPFPPAEPEAEGLSEESLKRLDALVAGFVKDQEVVGAELLVIKNGRTVLSTAHGFRDVAAKRRMAPGGVFCVRSMTKPLIGTAILMLIDDGKLRLGDRAATFLPAFDREGHREITIEHLLTHTSGLPLSHLMGKELKEVADIGEVAALGTKEELGFAPGTAFNYSDQGTDTLTAIIEAVTGAPPETFIEERILQPLGMTDSACLMTPDHPLRERACSNYAGQRGLWTRYWSPADASIFPCFLGSQGLYSTTRDYALFLDFWMKRGRTERKRLLGRRYVRKALRAGPHTFDAGTDWPGVQSGYGYLMQVWHGAPDPSRAGKRPLVAFGHGGSDGTHAWAFPVEKALVLYFTQSRGNTTGLRVEAMLGEVFLGTAPDPKTAPPPLEQYLGYYWEGEGDLYRAIVRDGEGLALEILGKAAVRLAYAGDDRWKFRDRPSVVLAFERSDSGEVTGYRIGKHREYRFQPAPDLPSVEELVTLVTRTHRLDRMSQVGALRLQGKMKVKRFGIEGEFDTVLLEGERFIDESQTKSEYERLTWDGKRLVYETHKKKPHVVEGQAERLLRPLNAFARFSDWRRWHENLRVIQRLEEGGRKVCLVRTGDTSAPASTLYVDLESGRVLREDGFSWVDPLGRIGQRVTFADFRRVAGMLLPFRTQVVFANPMAGKVTAELTVDSHDENYELPDGSFDLEKRARKRLGEPRQERR